MPDRKELERWLLSEDMEQDAAAEAAFTQLFESLPKVEPDAEFVQRTVMEVWRVRARRRRILAVGWAATIVLVAAGAVTAYVASPRLAPSVVKALAFTSGHAVPWLIAYATVAMNWWWTLAHVGGVIASALMTPAHAAAVVGVELFGILAFFALQRIAGAERVGDARV